ncbi:PQQ-dependent sugar dehydrogenase [Salinicoccus luteus]|uniref:PQQ-dependent sugar dehydrogenase n=1 Tax=Salinicoccus luteus TaxID=367840 RepID=UPI0004E126AC|nr:PQQ-dependent sugar dehydrogenase [Salinicoccus luteus]
MKRGIVLLVILMIGACSNEAASNGPDEAEILAEDLETPWMIEKAEEGFYISERGGVLKLVTDGETTAQSLELEQETHASGEGGLLGFILHPDDPDTAFLYHTYSDGGEKNRVVEMTRDGSSWFESDVVVEDIPGANIHNGGRMDIGPDGHLYITTGDAGNGEYSQDRNSLAGKILRVALDGSIPEDNPFGTEVYSYGHRNPQGLAWDEEGTLYATEHGASGHDEVNVIVSGANYGWPLIEGDEEEAGMETPFYHTGSDTWAPSGIAHDDGTLYIAALRGNEVVAFDLSSNAPSTFYDEGSRMRDVRVEENRLYTITNNTDGRGDPSEGDDRLLELEME